MARCNDLYDVKIIVRSSVKLLKEIKDLLKKNPTRQRLFRRTVFGPWLNILSHDNDNHLMHCVLHHQSSRKEFCLMTGFRFGKVSEKYSKLSPFCQCLFPEKITKKGVLNLKSIELLGVLRNTETWIGLSDMDAVRVCLLLVAELVFMGKEDRNCIPRHLVSLVEDFDCWNMYPWGEYMWVKFYQRTVNVAAKHREFHLVKKKQNPNYYPTYNLYGFPLSFKIWILETYPNSRKWWSKKDNVLPRALAWSNVAKFGKNDYNGLLGPDSNPKLELYATPLEQQTEWFKASIEYINGLVDLDMNVSEDDIGGDVSNNSFDLNENAVSGNGNNDVLLLEGGDGFVDSVCGDTNHEDKQDKQDQQDQQDKQPSLADVLHELRALRKEIALVKVDDARISKLERLLNDNFILSNDRSKGNHNAVNAGLTTSANHPLSTCSRHVVDNPIVACAGTGIHNPATNNDSRDSNHNDVNTGLSCSANDHMSNSSGPDIHLAEVAVACMEHDKGDGDGHIDIPTAIDNDVNLAKSVSVNDPMSNSSGPDIHLAEVVVACMEHDKGDGDGHIDIPTAIDNDVNLAKYVSVNDPMVHIYK
ncbi:phospholipase-like protein [Tanacetum coccineum]